MFSTETVANSMVKTLKSIYVTTHEICGSIETPQAKFPPQFFKDRNFSHLLERILTPLRPIFFCSRFVFVPPSPLFFFKTE